ncbi:MAG: alcohol dehydrogenase [Synergistaceae bacterium]|jgi:ribosomal protein S27AE|nr:alcohol dehydrogenase [Synergistaceae bacterium]
MVIAECEICGETKVLAGAPDRDGVARVNWTCCRCGTGQVLQIKVAGEFKAEDPRGVLGGMPLYKRKGDGGRGGVSASRDARKL